MNFHTPDCPCFDGVKVEFTSDDLLDLFQTGPFWQKEVVVCGVNYRCLAVFRSGDTDPFGFWRPWSFEIIQIASPGGPPVGLGQVWVSNAGLSGTGEHPWDAVNLSTISIPGGGITCPPALSTVIPFAIQAANLDYMFITQE